MVIGLIPLLTERGVSASTAFWALGLGGAGQTSARASVTTRTATLIALGGATTAALTLIPCSMPMLVVLAVLAGIVRGNLTLLQATAVADRWGTTN